MKDNYRFTDLEDKDKREEWWQKELAECAHCYRIPMYNLQLPLYFRRPPKHCVDVGTNVGTFSYYASGFFQNIYSYEAMKQTYEAAKENLQGVKNVKLHNLAVSDESDKEVKIVAHSSGLSGDSSVYNTTEDNLYEVVKTIDLDKIFVDAGFLWRDPGCSMCLGMNPDQLKPYERCASTSNRNFEGRQGNLGRTHLMSPLMAALTAINGKIIDPSS